MNIRSPMPTRTTRAAEGLSRRAFTVAEVDRMVELGVFDEDERFELIGGELVPMSPKGIRHEVLKQALFRRWVKHFGQEIEFIFETTLRLSDSTSVEPDLLVFEAGLPVGQLNASTVMLAVEVSDSSLGYDLGSKQVVYASHGIRELWVIDALRLVVHVHRDPGPDGYRNVVAHAPDALVEPLSAPVLTLRLSELELPE